MYKTDGELKKLIASGDENAFEELIRIYGGLIKSIVHYHLKSFSMWQEDCINEILFKIWKNIDRYDAEKNSLKNWVGAVAKYHAIDYKRRYYKELENTDGIEDKGIEDRALLKQEIDDEISSLLLNLKAEDREIFIKHYIMGFSPKEISAEKGKDTSWFYNRISRGKKRLRRLFSEEGQ